ncbi:hypothetical protein, partial [Klebsiella quasipneumoniae]|uniref:hypothetical protein n=1 Tax=Klebsiella quasipneumoniae TaxID=1463165 RepID=UPI003EE3920E
LFNKASEQLTFLLLNGLVVLFSPADYAAALTESTRFRMAGLRGREVRMKRGWDGQREKQKGVTFR